jgi:nucleotide-binding universal stress UspA family protein
MTPETMMTSNLAGQPLVGGFTGMLLGSTSQTVIYHAPCPLLVARPNTAPS